MDMAGVIPQTRLRWTWPATALGAALAAAALLAAAPAGADSRRTETVARGNVRATLTYVKRTDFGYGDMRLTIRRGGREVLSQRLPACRGCDVWPAYQGRRRSVSVRDLDRDGELEVAVDAYTGGAHCCLVLYAYGWNGRTYVSRQLNGASSGYRWADLNRDGRVEWVSADARFEGLFTAYANSVEPIRIYTYRSRVFVPVTRSFPSAIRADERDAWRVYLRNRDSRDVRGALAAWAADKHLLGEGDEVWPALAEASRRGDIRTDAGRPAGAAFVRDLRRALTRFGYAALG
jgi:hypothetical protein